MEKRAESIWRALALGVALAVTSLSVRAEYVFALVEAPGAISSFSAVFGINNSGQIVGTADFGVGFGSAFIYTAGIATPVAPPAGYFQVGFQGINDAGVAVGSAFRGSGPPPPETSPVNDGVIYSGGVMTIVSRPGYESTFFRAIGPTGLITGYSTRPDAAGDAFTYNPTSGVFTSLAPRGSPTGFFDIAQGINAAGQIVGSTEVGSDRSGFLYNPSTDSYELFKVGGFPTRARGINDAGLITGSANVRGRNVAFVANSSGYELLDPARIGGRTVTGILGQGINNLGQVVGFFTDGTPGLRLGFIASPAALPTGRTVDGAYTFDVAVVPDTPIFIDPFVAIGYDYTTGDGDPNFASVSLPIGIGDSLYKLIVDGLEFDLAGGDVFDFITNGFAGGVSKFGVRGIETSAALNPDDPAAFVTQLTFTGRGRFTGSMTPISVFVPDATVPEPSALALAGLGLLALVPALRRRRR